MLFCLISCLNVGIYEKKIKLKKLNGEEIIKARDRWTRHKKIHQLRIITNHLRKF